MAEQDGGSRPIQQRDSRRVPISSVIPLSHDPSPQSGDQGIASRNDAITNHLRSTEVHQYLADYGLCWQDDYFYTPMLESGPIGFGDLPEEVLERVSWTGAQKATFCELLGRKSAVALPEIAEIIGKSVFECETYLSLLRSNAKHLAIDYCEIPAAVEVPAGFSEPDFANAALDRDSSSKVEKEANLFVLNRIRNYTGMTLSPDAVHGLYTRLRAKIVEWISSAGALSMGGTNISITAESILQVIGREFDTEKVAHMPDDNTTTESSGPESGPESISDHEESDTENLEHLLKREEEWLDQLDVFQSQLTLQGYPSPHIPPPPPGRDTELEKFMQSR